LFHEIAIVILIEEIHGCWYAFPKINRSESLPGNLLIMELKYFENKFVHVMAIVILVP
jgi:hypothetical protein